jgi:hypothetical protein
MYIKPTKLSKVIKSDHLVLKMAEKWLFDLKKDGHLSLK